MMESTAEQNRAIDTQHVGGSASPAELDATPTARQSGDLSSATTPNQVLAIVSVGMILANLDLFVVNVALPNIALDFANPSLERLSWILNGYTIAYAALLVFFGRLSERYPRNVSFLVGIGAFTAASAACAAAIDTEMLVVFRVVQAAAAEPRRSLRVIRVTLTVHRSLHRKVLIFNDQIPLAGCAERIRNASVHAG
jgi:Major Facilitator Superfamily